jgi:hypothetical protein
MTLCSLIGRYRHFRQHLHGRSEDGGKLVPTYRILHGVITWKAIIPVQTIFIMDYKMRNYKTHLNCNLFWDLRFLWHKTQAEALWRADHSSKESYCLCKIDLETEIWGQGPRKGCRAIGKKKWHKTISVFQDEMSYGIVERYCGTFAQGKDCEAS